MGRGGEEYGESEIIDILSSKRWRPRTGLSYQDAIFLVGVSLLRTRRNNFGDQSGLRVVLSCFLHARLDTVSHTQVP